MQFHDLEHFYDHQRPTWEKLRKAHAAFQLNRLELEKDAEAGPALKRMQEILSAPSPYGLIKEADALINTRQRSELISAQRTASGGHCQDRRPHRRAEQGSRHSPRGSQSASGVPGAAQGPAGAGTEARKPRPHHPGRERGREGVRRCRGPHRERSWPSRRSPKDDGSEEFTPPPAVVKKQRIIKPAEIMKTAYLETPDDVNGFLDALRQELEKALANNERIQIR